MLRIFNKVTTYHNFFSIFLMSLVLFSININNVYAASGTVTTELYSAPSSVDPGDWVFFDSFTLDDLKGIPTAYAIMYHDANSTITTLEDLSSTMEEIRVKRD